MKKYLKRIAALIAIAGMGTGSLAAADVIIKGKTGESIKMYSGSTNTATVDSSGNVTSTGSVKTDAIQSKTGSVDIKNSSGTTGLSVDSSGNVTSTGSVKTDVIQSKTGSVDIKNNSGTTRLSVDSSGNVGINGTPNATLSLPQGANINFRGPVFYLDSNSAYSSGSDRYVVNGYATRYQSVFGVQTWSAAASGTAGNPITWIQALSIGESGAVSLPNEVKFSGKSIKKVRSFLGNTSFTTVFRETGSTVQGTLLMRIFTAYNTPSAIGSLTELIVLPNKSTIYTLRQVGESINGYGTLSWQWSGNDFQIKTNSVSVYYTVDMEFMSTLNEWSPTFP
jgi:hypothetical protein